MATCYMCIIKHCLPIFGCCKSYDTPSGASTLNTAHHTDVYLYKIHELCIAALKPLFALLVRDMKDTWNSYIKMVFS